MTEPDSLDALLREWKAPEPEPNLDQRVTSAYRSALGPRSSSVLRRFWSMRVSVPAPALVAVALALVAVFLWVRGPAAPAATTIRRPVLTQLNATGFQPLPNGAARVVRAAEIQQ